MELLRPIIKPKKNFVDFVSLFFVLAVLFGVAIFSLVLYNAYNDNVKDKLATALTSSTPVDENANVTKILDDTSSGISKLDTLFPFLLVGVLGYVLILALLARSHPAFFFIGLIVLGVAIILAVTFSNVYGSIAETSSYTATNQEFNIISLIMDNLPIIILVLFIGMAIILYAMRQGPPRGGAY